MTVELILGDCLEVMRTMPDKSVDAVITDLPYGTTACKWDAIIPFEPMWEHVKRIDKGAFVTTASQPFTTKLIASNIDEFRYDLIWDKKLSSGFLNANQMPLRSHETICIFGGSIYNPQKTIGKPNHSQGNTTSIKTNCYGESKRIDLDFTNMKHPKSVLQIQKIHPSKTEHPTQKPVELMEWLIKTYTNEGDTVLDITMGSGTTGVACVQTGRNFIGIEIDPTYFAIAEKRIKEAQMQPRLEM